MSSGVSFPGSESRSYQHGFTFDPAHGFHPNSLLDVEPPPAPDRFDDFWRDYYDRVRNAQPRPEPKPSALTVPGRDAHEVFFNAHDGLRLHGWLTLPKSGPVRRAFISGHGYGGRTEPESWLPAEDAAGFFPSARGISTSRCQTIPENPQEHILHGIHDPGEYILGRCAADVWTAVSVIEELVPEAAGRIDFMGTSFGGGVGMLALPWERRISSSHMRVPSFGHYPLRLKLPCTGSGKAVAAHVKEYPEAVERLRLFDAAISATRVEVPVHIAAALFDPVVPPAGQFAIYNALPCEKELFILHAGHFEHPEQRRDYISLCDAIEGFFALE